MRGYLLDTSIVSILDPGRGMMSAEFASWLMVREPRTYISAVTVFEAAQGIEKLVIAEKHERAQVLDAWLAGIIIGFGERILPIDTETAHAAGNLSAKAFSIGRHPGVADIMIGATALHHDLLLLTRNAKHFVPLEVPVADPMERLPR